MTPRPGANAVPLVKHEAKCAAIIDLAHFLGPAKMLTSPSAMKQGIARFTLRFLIVLAGTKGADVSGQASEIMPSKTLPSACTITFPPDESYSVLFPCGAR